MRKSVAAPTTIRRIAARRVYRRSDGTPVIVTIGMPRAVPGSDWGCPVQISGLNTAWRRPKYVFGIDGFQALHLAMQCAGAVIQSAKVKLEWLGQSEDLGIPRVLPWLPTPDLERLEVMIAREVTRSLHRAERAHKARTSKRRKRPPNPARA